ncbi:MAG: RagB/SusD family nutrient uptake outer membrane protein [Bacteroidales bacterium]|nr:RagB/SusD family nutrient uptake outer membrane protein [Bacteroidales bacterium]MCM1147896.1 RagB/SusD family nutrient uptake outer membrane protein [Bacteroidales bacterium]MCM1206739.1 RagB/SusD family nutrient uptake outer membrane protein [Bacillota bacterium]MCM1510934.1 RagB/SusD family nutrient uptake outer membrane protein [Clostridium sp.]
MKKTFANIYVAAALAMMGGSLQSCSLEEENPGGFTLEDLATQKDGFQELVNQCYFAMERYFYGTDGFMELTEGDTDLWTYKANDTESREYFWFFGGASPNTTYTNNLWNGIYDGVGACNTVIANADKARAFLSEAELNEKIAEARFMRAIYYFNAVEQFGAVTMNLRQEFSANYAPERTAPLDIYRQLIIPDLEYAAQWLDKGTDALCTTPTKKAALGFLAKACLQTREYGTDEFLQKGMDAAKTLITDCENGGTTYGAFMYADYADVFKESNNWENKEALWKHRWYAGSNGHGSSNGNWKLNRNVEKFQCILNKFGAREINQAQCISWDTGYQGVFMPTQHLLSLFVQADGTLDPRFHNSFTTEWNANKAYVWQTADDANLWGKDLSVVGTGISVGDKAIRFIMPQDADYAAEKAATATAPYLVVDYKAVYNDAGRNVIMTDAAGNENQFRYFYPSLNKHNSSRWYVANASKQRNGNLNATFMMRMAEVYLIAAELDIYLNGGSAMTYINKVRTRANANPLSGTATVRTVLDERGRELCGEYNRFYDLKRTGMLKDATYLSETHPDLAHFFNPNFALRPISTTFTATITNGAEYQNPGY